MGDIRGAEWPSDVECDPHRLRIMMHMLRDAREGARIVLCATPHPRPLDFFVGDRTFFSISWMYKKQCAVSHSSDEAKVVSLVSAAGDRLQPSTSLDS